MKWYLKVLQNYTTFSGRARRSEYWYFVLFNLIASTVFALLDSALNIQAFQGLYAFFILLPSITVGVRRMHDVGKSGWFLLIPIYNIVLACTAGENGENKYGADPKQDIPTFDFEQSAV